MDDPEIISRSEAKAQGLKTYFTGKPCKHGHVAIRQTSNGSCRECSDAKARRWRQENQEYVRKKNRSYHADHYARNREKVIEKSRQYYEANKPMALHRAREYYIRKHLPEHAEHRLLREIERLDDWKEIRNGLATPKKGKRRG
jgi:hypothetical protein